ncbi:hypothetical protein [Paraliomyxa miuraensis]|uniref:hypothetical protein n=1 Tax=Paraliomyxa miuraensis TaxID=376150 RepID=UPI002257B8B0|nr:hypothetical protein [Paraliomyxa miuraensis]MCX4244708.1 hypothetical protein [Paraliomyxa miuraensis]
MKSNGDGSMHVNSMCGIAAREFDVCESDALLDLESAHSRASATRLVGASHSSGPIARAVLAFVFGP